MPSFFSSASTAAIAGGSACVSSAAGSKSSVTVSKRSVAQRDRDPVVDEVRIEAQLAA